MAYAYWFWLKNGVTNFGHIEFKEGAVYCYDVFTPFARIARIDSDVWPRPLKSILYPYGGMVKNEQFSVSHL